MARFPDISIHMNLCTRPAIFTPGHDVPKHNLKKGDAVRVDVFGLYQVKVDYDDIDAYFVVELQDGSCIYAAVNTIQFTDREDEAHEPLTYCD